MGSLEKTPLPTIALTYRTRVPSPGWEKVRMQLVSEAYLIVLSPRRFYGRWREASGEAPEWPKALPASRVWG